MEGSNINLTILPIHAKENEVIDIYWHTLKGTFIQRITCSIDERLKFKLLDKNDKNEPL